MANKLTVSYNGNSNFYTEEKEGKFNIKYGSYISEELDAGQSRTLKCGGCVMDGNLIIGNKTFNCNKYKMASDVDINVISLFPSEPSAYNLINTYYNDGKFTAEEDGWFQIELQGASGYGGTSSLDADGYYGGGGGGGGGCAISRVKMKKDDTVVYSLGTPIANSNNGNTQEKAGDSTATVDSSFNEYDHKMTVTGATNGSKARIGITGKGGAGGVGSGNYANYSGKSGSDGQKSTNATTASGGAAGYSGGNAGGNGASQAGANQSYAGAGSKGFIKIYRGNTNLS